MKLFLYDEKHDQILDYIDVEDDTQTLRIIDFLDKNKVTNRYNKLVFAHSYEQKYNGDGFSEITFIY